MVCCCCSSSINKKIHNHNHQHQHQQHENLTQIRDKIAEINSQEFSNVCLFLFFKKSNIYFGGISRCLS